MFKAEHTTSFQEQRRYPRINHKVPFTLKPDSTDLDFVGETLNLSCNGVLCQVNTAVAEMTVLKMTLEFPSNNCAECEGTVVRVEEDPENNSHHLAIFFHDISDANRDKIADYIRMSCC